MSKRMTRTTLALPPDLLTEVDQAVNSGMVHSRNELIYAAIRHELDRLERVTIDAAFSMMADDDEYVAEVEAINQEFAQADWEAYRVGERQYAGRDDATR